MNRDIARNEVKRRLDEYLQRKGIDPRKEFKCFNKEHKDAHPSMKYDPMRYRVHCFSCGASYDIFDLIGMDYGLTNNKDIFDKAYQLFNIVIDDREDSMNGQNNDKSGQDTHIHTHTDVYTHTDTQPQTDYTAYYEECKSRILDTRYHRGLSKETLERHYIGYDPHFKTKDSAGNYTEWKALIIPTGKGSYVARNTDKEAGHKDRYRKRGQAQIFGYKALKDAEKPIFIVEGEIDAMSIEEAGGVAVGLGSLDNIPSLLKLLENDKPNKPLIIALDEEVDPDKREMVSTHEKTLTDGLDSLQITYYRLRPFAGYHDANEALTEDREAFINAIAGAELSADEERKKYLSSNAGAYLQEFINGIAKSVDTECLPTGFRSLDSTLDGGLYEGLYAIGAISSLGKTSFALQIADMIASSGHDVLIFSLEMARTELMSKSISRHTVKLAMERRLLTANAKTSRGITDGKRYENYSKTETQLIQDAISAYGEYAERLYIQEGVGDIGAAQIRQTVEKHILYTGGKWETNESTGMRELTGGRRPLVIVDYIQILAPHNDKATDKQNMDKAILELKRISRDYKLPVIAISAFNRSSYKAEAMFEALKESGAIEYTSDVVIGLQLKGAGQKDFNPTQEKKRDPRQIEAVILKNRQGKVGDKILFDYYPMFNYFVDKGAEI